MKKSDLIHISHVDKVSTFTYTREIMTKKSASPRSSAAVQKPHRATYELPVDVVKQIDSRIAEQPHYKLSRNAIIVEALMFYFAHRSEGVHSPDGVRSA